MKSGRRENLQSGLLLNPVICLLKSESEEYCGMTMENSFWTRLDELIESSEIVLDRPKGSRHPTYTNIVFPLDYGYLEGTTTVDGNGIDIWSGTAEHRRLTAIACTVDVHKRDAEIKLLIGCTDEEIKIIEEFHNGPYQSAIIIRRKAD